MSRRPLSVARLGRRVRRRLRGAGALLVLPGAVAGAAALAGSAGPAPPPGSLSARVNPLDDPRGLHPGLTPVPGSRRAQALARIGQVEQAPRGSGRGYERERDFGEAWTDDNGATWGHDGCRTREEILHRDVRAPTLRPGTDGCVVLDGLLQEPYTGKLVEFTKQDPQAIQIDHLVPLAYAWRQGARIWTQARRVTFANDPLNLLAVDGPLNSRKSDSGPGDWLPPNRRVRCAYVVRFAMVALKYRLPVPPRDRQAMQRSC